MSRSRDSKHLEVWRSWYTTTLLRSCFTTTSSTTCSSDNFHFCETVCECVCVAVVALSGGPIALLALLAPCPLIVVVTTDGNLGPPQVICWGEEEGTGSEVSSGYRRRWQSGRLALRQ